METKDSYIIFHINGNPEKDLIATCVVSSLKEAKPDKKIIVVTHFPDIWLHNSDVHRVYKMGATPYFYEDFVVGKNSEIYAHDPYLTSGYINGEKPVAEIWCEMIKIKYNNSKPKLYFTQREEEVAWRLTQRNKPVLLIQGNETFPIFPNLEFNWTKDLPIDVLQKIANEAIRRGYDVVQIRNQNQPAIEGAVTLTLNLRLSLAILPNITKILAIDSYLQHACTAVNKSAVITWLSTSPKTRGYKLHKNILANITSNIKNRLDEYSPIFDAKGEHVRRPALMEDVYDVNEIIKALDL